MAHGEGSRLILSAPLKSLPFPPTVPVGLKGQPVWMMLDTGASLMKLDARLANLLVDTHQSEQLITANGVQMRLPLGVLPHLTFGRQEITNALSSVVDLRPFREFFGMSFGGVIPYAFLNGRALRLDFDAHVLEVLAGEVSPPPNWSSLPLSLNAGGCPQVRLQVNGVNVDFQIDTGYNACCDITASLVQRLLEDRQVTMTVQEGKSLDATGAATANQEGWFNSGTLMGKPLQGVEFNVTQGIPKLGMTWLLAFNLILDSTQSKLYYKLRENPTPPIAPELMTGIAFQFSQDGLVIARLRPGGGPGQSAGLLAGDVVTRIGGISYQQLDGYALYEIIARSAGTPIACEYLRAGDPTTVRHCEINVGKTESCWDYAGRKNLP